jgi:predicted TIM-barrel fold metal-dependent hydrolase
VQRRSRTGSIPVAAMPFWDVGRVREGGAPRGREGPPRVLAASQPEAWGEPIDRVEHWDPFWAAVQETGVPISFHIGGGDLSELFIDTHGLGMRANFARQSSMIFMQNVHCIADLIFGGVCHRFPSSDSCRWRAASAGSRRTSRRPTGSS